MKQELKDKWVNALECGIYQQGSGALRTNLADNFPDQFCCLGVLCDVIDPQGWNGTIRDGNSKKRSHSSSAGGGVSLGFIDIGLIDNRTQIKLTNMNDSGSTFKEIADWIKNNIEAEE